MPKRTIRFLSLFAAGLLVGASLFIAPTVANAEGDANCPHGANFVSSACYYGVAHNGAYTEFHNNYLSIDSTLIAQGYHINQTIWTYSGSPCSHWVEEGITKGYHGANVYAWYFAKNNSAGYQDWQSNTTTADGSNHSYQLVEAGSNSYSVYRDGSLLLTAAGMSGSCVSQAGLEITNAGFQLTYTTADTFNSTPLWARSLSGYWTVGWPGGHAWTDWPCGIYSVPNCMNGTYYGTNQWSDNKPS
jgi:hypothetical protein